MACVLRISSPHGPSACRTGLLHDSRYPRVHGLRYNGCVLPAPANTFVNVLRRPASRQRRSTRATCKSSPTTRRIGRCRRNRSRKKFTPTLIPATARSRIKSSRRGGTSSSSFSFLSQIRITPSSAGQVLGYVKPEDFELALPMMCSGTLRCRCNGCTKTGEAGVARSCREPVMIDDRQLQEAMALTNDIIACIDDAVGNLTAALEDLGHAATRSSSSRPTVATIWATSICYAVHLARLRIGCLASDWTSWSQPPTSRSLFSSVRVCAPSLENFLPHLEAGARRCTTPP